MSYEFSNIEWKLYPHQLRLEFELFHDTKVLDNPIWKDQAKKHLDIDLTIKSTAYRILIKKFTNYFKEEQHRIRTSINIRSIGDPDELFSRYLVTNYNGLIQLEDNSKATKPKRVSFTSSEFTEHYEQQTLTQILYYLQTLFVIPLFDFIETNFSDDIAANNLSTSSAYSQNKFRKKTNIRNRSFN